MGDVHDALGHGTHCTRLILTVAPDATVTPLRVFEQCLETSPNVLVSALEWALTCDFDILNLSLATDREDARDLLYVLCGKLQNCGTLVVAAALGGTYWGYPAVFDNVIGVGLMKPGTQTAAVQSPIPLDVLFERGWRGPEMGRYPVPPLTSTSQAAAYVSGILARQMMNVGNRLALEEARDVLRRVPGLGSSAQDRLTT